MSCSEILIHFQPFLSCLFQRNFQKFEDKVTYMLRRNSLAIYVWRRHKSKLNTYGNRSYLNFGFPGEGTPLHCYDVMNAFNMLREHRQKRSVKLSGFWPLRGWGDLSESVKKGKFMPQIFFSINAEWSFKYFWKMISADAKANESNKE